MFTKMNLVLIAVLTVTLSSFASETSKPAAAGGESINVAVAPTILPTCADCPKVRATGVSKPAISTTVKSVTVCACCPTEKHAAHDAATGKAVAPAPSSHWADRSTKPTAGR